MNNTALWKEIETFVAEYCKTFAKTANFVDEDDDFISYDLKGDSGDFIEPAETKYLNSIRRINYEIRAEENCPIIHLWFKKYKK